MLLPILHLADVIANNVWRNTIQISVDDVISTKFWLMLLPIVWCGWCYYHLADVIAIGWRMADVKSNVSYVMIPGLGYFSLSSVMLFRTSSHTWGRWYLPMFLLRDGLLTLMYIASLISLFWLFSSLPTTLKLLIVVSWPVMKLWSKIGEGVLNAL